MKIISWRMLTAATIFLIAVSAGAAAEVFDEMPPGDMSLMFPEHIFIDPGHQAPLPETNDDSAVTKGLLLSKMLTSMINQDGSPNVLAGPKWMSTGTMLVPVEAFENISLLKEPMIKRDVDVTVTKTRKLAKPVQKWKVKKVKLGPTICYFKLCAFRRPPTK